MFFVKISNFVKKMPSTNTFSNIRSKSNNLDCDIYIERYDGNVYLDTIKVPEK